MTGTTTTRLRVKVTVATVLLLYLVSFGPYVALAARMGWGENRVIIWAGAIYLPHAYLAAKMDAYNRYTTWWIRLGDSKMAAEFREAFESGPITTGL
jgi:hypothetical protein